MTEGIKITQSRIPVSLYNEIKERAHNRHISINRKMIDLMEKGIIAEDAEIKASA